MMQSSIPLHQFTYQSNATTFLDQLVDCRVVTLWSWDRASRYSASAIQNISAAVKLQQFGPTRA